MSKKVYNTKLVLKYVKGRKNYLCSTCGGLIKKGTYHLYENFCITGYWVKNRFCRKCDLDEINSRKDETKIPLLERRISLLKEASDV